MLSYFELRKGTFFLYQGRPCEVLEFQQIYKAQDVPSARVKFRDLISGNILQKNFHQGEEFEEPEIEKVEIIFLFSKRDSFFFCEKENQRNRFELKREKIGERTLFLKPGMILNGLKFEGKIINIQLPIKVQLRVVEAPPTLKGERAQGSRKTVLLETGAKINAPSFIEAGDIVEINTETGEYVKRVEKNE